MLSNCATFYAIQKFSYYYNICIYTYMFFIHTMQNDISVMFSDVTSIWEYELMYVFLMIFSVSSV